MSYVILSLAALHVGVISLVVGDVVVFVEFF